MKRILFGTIAICMIIVSCKKEHKSDITINSTQKLYKVGYNVGFSQQSGGFISNSLKANGLTTTSVDTSLSNHVSVLQYAVYDSVGNRVHVIQQLLTDTAFGKYTDNLHPGKYTIAIAAGAQFLSVINGTPGGYLPAPLPTPNISADVLEYYGNGHLVAFVYDTFFKKFPLVVAAKDTSMHIALDRITAKLSVVVKDALPATAHTMGLTSPAVPQWFFINSATAGHIEPQFASGATVTTAQIGTTNFTMSAFLLYSTPITLNIYCANSGGTTLAYKTIPNLTLQANTQTILTGNLFGGSGTTSTGGVNLGIDTAWNHTPIVKTF